MKADCCICRPI